jgi:hypothetical protein
MGWDNWTMEIIAFHNCEDLYSARKQEQHYFEEYNATLNSIEPLPLRKPKKRLLYNQIKKYCIVNLYVKNATLYPAIKKTITVI